MAKLLSKSKYLNGIQCPKLLWITVNEPDRLPEIDAATQRIFDQGHLIGDLAKHLFPEGINIPYENFLENILATKEALELRRTVFEAGFKAKNLFARADALKPSGKDAWDIIEVKSSTGVKDINIQDVAFQKYCYQKAGLEIDRCYIMHINNTYVRKGDIDPLKLFAIVDITDDVMLELSNVPDRIEDMQAVIKATECPEVSIGGHCSTPYECALAECWQGLPDHNVFTLYRGGKLCTDLYNQGIFSIQDIPSTCKLSAKQKIQFDCVKNNEAYTDRGDIKAFLSSLENPLYFLDFETIGTAIPLFDGTKPYQNIPFQFSLHYLPGDGSELKNYSYLADGPDDPRPSLLDNLRKYIENTGSIIAYNKSFEQSVLNDLSKAFPERQGWIEDVISRLVDLLTPFRNFDYYHPAQNGSASIKHVLPAITGNGYEGLTIAQGNDASLAYLTMTYGEMPEEEKAVVRDDLLKYCRLDTEGMVRILRRLKEIS